MEIRNITSFCKIVECGSFSKAATELGYTQSNVTMQIKQLESELDCKLFDRIGKSIELTSEGKDFVKYAISILSSIEDAKSSIKYKSSPSGELKIGVIESLCITYMPHLITEFYQKYPQVNTIIKTGTFEELSNMLNSNQVDLIWTFDRPIVNSHWQMALEYTKPICIIASYNHPLCKKKDLTLSNLAHENFIFTEKSCSYRQLFESKLLAEHIDYQIFMEIGNTEIIKKFVSSGMCLSVLPEFATTAEVSEKKLSILSLEDFEEKMYGQVFYHSNKWVTPAMKEFFSLLQTQFHS